MRERNRSGRGGRRREGADDGDDLFAKELSDIVEKAFVERAEFSEEGAPAATAPAALDRGVDQAESTGSGATAESPTELTPTEVSTPNIPLPVVPPEPIPARMLNEFVYCPRLFYYEHVEGVFVDNADTIRGAAIHSRVDKGSGAMPAAEPRKEGAATEDGIGPEESASAGKSALETIHSRSVMLGSQRLGVIAKLDLVETRRGAERGVGNEEEEEEEKEEEEEGELLARLEVCPVDYKAGAPREGEDGNELWPTDKMQLGLQILLLRDNGYRCGHGLIYYRATKQRVPLEMTSELEAWVLSQIEAARRAMTGPIPPPLVGSAKCVRCSLNSVCLPDETRLLTERPVDAEGLMVDGAQSSGRSTINHSPSASTAVPPRRLMSPRDDTRVLYLNKPGLRVGRKDELLVVKEENKTLDEIRIGDLTHVALFGNIQISSQAVQALCEKEVSLTYFSMGGWFYGITRGHELKNVFTRMEQFRLARDPSFCLALARRMVHGKIRNHRTMLMRLHLEPPAPIVAKLKTMADSALQAQSIGELLGTEGAAAHFYFSTFAGMLKAEDEFTDSDRIPGPQLRFNFAGRNRRPPTDPVNALLSLAYSLLAKEFTLAAMAVGLDPYVGFYHQPRFGRPALALDVMEEFRPLIAESAVLTAINNRMILPKHFVRAGQAVNLSAPGRKLFFQAYEQRMSALITHPIFEYKVSYRRVVELQFRLLARFITGEIPEYPPFLTR